MKFRIPNGRIVFSHRLKGAVIIFLVIVIAPFLLSFTGANKILLNQFEIQSNEIRYGTVSIELLWDWVRSVYSAGLNVVRHPPIGESFDFSNPDSVFGYIFNRLPSYTIVYPTETYYYYKFTVGDETVSGNMRLLDAGEGKIHLGYFHTNDPHGEGGYKLLTKEDGVTVHAISPYRFEVEYRGKEVTFKLSDFYTRPPVRLRMLPEEEFVAHIWDESGIKFFLLYNNATKSFYYVLDEENGVTDAFEKGQEHYFIGKRTQYVWYEDKDFDRKVLVGVSRGNIFENNYFDGPFDQLPPRLPIKEKVLAAYPYTAYAGGIDAHGNFNGFKGTRIAISAYYDYDTLENLYSYHKRCEPKKNNKGEFWSCLTYEWKKDFHKTLEKEGYPKDAKGFHAIYVSQGWPANHLGDVSLTWPENHKQEESKKLQPNFKFPKSLLYQ